MIFLPDNYLIIIIHPNYYQTRFENNITTIVQTNRWISIRTIGVNLVCTY